MCTSKHRPLYACSRFKSISHHEKFSVLKMNNLCLNCFGSGHFAEQCKSSHRCRKCQRQHHTLIHHDSQNNDDSVPSPSFCSTLLPTQVISNAAVKLRSSSLLMICHVLVFAPDGTSVEARALLDNGSISSFVSECLVQGLWLSRSQRNVCVSGIAGSLASSLFAL